MSTADIVKGQEAFKNSDYPTAIHHLTLALKNSQSPLWLIQRSTAYQRTGQHELALADADNAVIAAHSRGKRELIATAHFRRAVALHGLGRYGDARLCLLWCQKFNEKEKGVTMWQAKVKSDYDKAGGEDAECNKTTVKEVPDKVEEVAQKTPEDKENSKPAAAKFEKAAAAKAEPVVPGTETSKTPSAVSAQATTAQTPKEKIRQEWYQSPSTVTIEIFAKGVPKDTAEVNIQEGSLDVSFPIAAFNSTYDYTVTPLFSKVDTSKSNFRITPHKIEIILHKSMPGLKWTSLEGTAPIESTTVPEPASKIPDEVLKAPAYPTSSRSGPKNWDTIVGDEDDKDDEGEQIDGFFKKLYKDADPDTKRAMMKSYQESNGTALSTSWSDVGSKKVETVPPEGLEAKKWEI